MTDRITFTGSIAPEGRRLRGQVVIAGSRTFRNGEWLEVDPAALVKADATNVVATVDHDPTKLLGRTTNGTLKLSRTDTGIEYETGELPNTSAANDALELARGGYFGGSSFQIEGLRSTFSTDPDGTRVRRITSIKRLVDVSPVYDPAFSNSTASAFSKESPVTDQINETEAPAPAPAPTIVAAKPADDKSDMYRTAEAFARKQDLNGLQAAMENLIAGGELTPANTEAYEAFAAVYDERKRVNSEARERQERIALAHALRTGKGPKAPRDRELFDSEDYKAATDKYLRTGDSRHMEQFAQSIAGDGSQGGYGVPASPSLAGRITESKAAYGGIQQVADSITTGDGRDLPWPSNDDTSNSAAIATEGSAVGSAGADLVFGQISLGAYTYDATGASNLPLLVSKELLQDAAFDVEAFVGRKLGERLGRKMAADYANGSGSGAPLGLFTKTPDTMSATKMFAALVEHMFQVNEAYRMAGNCRWILSDATLAKVYNSVDGNGRPLFIPNATSSGASAPAGQLLGYPVTLDQAAGDNVAFGDFRQGFIIRNVRGVTIDVDPYTAIKSRQIAFHAWARTDSTVQDSAAYSVSDYSGVSADS